MHALPWPVFAATPTGRILDVNAAGVALLDSNEPGDDLEKHLRAFACSSESIGKRAGKAGDGPAAHDIYLGRAALRLHRLPSELALLPGRECMVIGVERRPLNPFAEPILRQRFGLTARQARVARLLARGTRAAEIAAELKLSIHTVRRHTEAVLLKLGVTSRAALIHRILGEQADWDEFPED